MTFRWLCLHGATLNAEIFKIELGDLHILNRDKVVSDILIHEASIRYILELDCDVEFEFINAEVNGPKAQTQDLYELFDGPHLYWWPDFFQGHQEDIDAAHGVVARAIEELGPFDGIIGHSQGATLAFDILLRHTMKRMSTGRDVISPFRCAVLIGGARSYDFWTTETQTTLKKVDASELGLYIQQPALIVVGDEDDFPVMSEYHHIRDFWKEEACSLFVYKGHHGLPTDNPSNIQLATEIRKLMSITKAVA